MREISTSSTKSPKPPKHLNIQVGESGQDQQGGSFCMYIPMINLKPAEHSSILSVLLVGIKKLKKRAKIYSYDIRSALLQTFN